MDASSFDRLTRFVAAAHSRRIVGGAVLGAVAGLLSHERVAAAPCPKGQKRCRQRCIPRRKCCTSAQCRPKATGRVCRRGRCVCSKGKKRCRKRCIPKTQCCTTAQCRPIATGRICQNGTCLCPPARPKLCQGRCLAPGDCCPTECPGHGEPNTVVACVGQKCQLTRSYTTPGPHPFTAPAAGKVTAELFGGSGGAGGAGQLGTITAGGAGGFAGLGGRIFARIPIAADESFQVIVGGVGSPGASGAEGGAGGQGANGADPGGTSQGNAEARGGGGGGGGGSSELRLSPFLSFTLVAGGGGGGGGALAVPAPAATAPAEMVAMVATLVVMAARAALLPAPRALRAKAAGRRRCPALKTSMGRAGCTVAPGGRR